MRRILRLAATAAVALGAAACGEADPFDRQAVDGTVTLDGQPLESGLITLSPDDGTDPVVSGVIEQGAFAIRAPEARRSGRTR